MAARWPKLSSPTHTTLVPSRSTLHRTVDIGSTPRINLYSPSRHIIPIHHPRSNVRPRYTIPILICRARCVSTFCARTGVRYWTLTVSFTVSSICFMNPIRMIRSIMKQPNYSDGISHNLNDWSIALSRVGRWMGLPFNG